MMKTLQIRKILVPIDFTNASINALELAAAIAHRYQAEIHLLYVDDSDYDLFKEDPKLTPPGVTDYMKMLAKLAKKVINHHGIACSYASERGAVTHCILKTAIYRYADLIVVGKSGTNGPSEIYAGTHTLQLAEKSRIGVLIVPERTNRYGFENILFPVRPLLSVPEKYDAIRPFILKNKAAMTILTLRNPAYENELHIIHRLSLIIQEKLEKDAVPYEMEHYFADDRFAEHVLSRINLAEPGFDLVVITAESDKSVKDFHMGYYARKIIQECSIPVLILRPDTARQDKAYILQKLDKQVGLA